MLCIFPENAVAILVWGKLFNKKDSEDDFFSTQRVFVINENKLEKFNL